MKYPPFLISPFWLAVLFGLVYLWLHCVASLSKRLTPQGKSEPYLNLLIILTGPLAWIGWWGGKRRMHTKDGWKGLVSSVKAFVRRRWGSRRYDENVITILAGADGTVATSLSRRSGHHNEAMALTLARQMIDWAVDLRASDIFMDPKQEQAYELRYRVDGLLREPQRIERETALATLNCFKILAEMNIAERRRAQDGSLLAYYNDREIKLRVATAGTVYGEKIVIRVLDAADQALQDAGYGADKPFDRARVGVVVGTMFGGSNHTGAGGNKHQLNVFAIGEEGQLRVDVERERVGRQGLLGRIHGVSPIQALSRAHSECTTCPTWLRTPSRKPCSMRRSA